MRIHLTSIGGAVMHNLAIALHKNGHIITGSDDEIYEPSRSRLEKYGLLPEKEGWDAGNITDDLDAVILGMHARKDNPEIQQAQKSNIPVYSFPEFIYKNSIDKTRIVIGGSHGKTTTTSMIMHVLKYFGRDFDYLVGAQLEGFDTMVKLSDAPVIVIEGDEYLSSAIDRRPKFLHYKPHIAILTGIAWDHINVFPVFEGYVEQFANFIKSIESGGSLIYYEKDENVKKIAHINPDINEKPYSGFGFEVKNGHTFVKTSYNEIVPIKIFGEHNMANMKAAFLACSLLGIDEFEFLTAMRSFSGAAKRLQILKKSDDSIIFKDFAHAPSKVKATVEAVKMQYPDRQLVACIELHTFSSLNKKFLPQYKGALDKADIAIVFYSEHTLKMKKLPAITPDDIKIAFEKPDLLVITDKNIFAETIEKMDLKNKNLLLMSSGTFGGLNFDKLG